MMKKNKKRIMFLFLALVTFMVIIGQYRFSSAAEPAPPPPAPTYTYYQQAVSSNSGGTEHFYTIYYRTNGQNVWQSNGGTNPNWGEPIKDGNGNVITEIENVGTSNQQVVAIDLAKLPSGLNPSSSKPSYEPPAWASTLSKLANYFYSGAGVGPTKTNWYEVEQWEIDACRIWGGASSANRASSGADEVSTITLSQLTASLQGKKTAYPDNTTLYEASWYIEPITGSVNYKILLINSQGESTVLVPSGTASSLGGSSQYLPIGPILNNATNNFTRIEMRKADDSLLIRTKIVDYLTIVEVTE